MYRGVLARPRALRASSCRSRSVSIAAAKTESDGAGHQESPCEMKLSEVDSSRPSSTLID